MTAKTVRLIAALLAALLLLVGAGAMLVCGLFMFSSDSRDIMGAGLGFVGGTVLVGAGTITLAITGLRSPQTGP